MSLQRKENNLRRAQARFDKVSKRSKQFQINFRREQNSRGRFRTRAYIVRGEKTHYSGRGIIHKVAHAKYRITGDAPSITRAIKSWQPILKVSDSKNWKDGLVSFGANRRDLSDTPDQWVWGRSTVYDYEPEYDFNCYKLWSSLCAYYYDFDVDNDDIYYWKFDSDTKNLLEEMFNDEYEFVYWYDNQSRWEELSPYNYWGGGKADLGGTYYRADKIAYIYNSQPYKYRFKPLAITSELAKYEDSNGYLCITDNYRVLDPNNGYKETGFYIMDHRYFSGEKRPFYYVDNDTGGYYFLHGGTRYNRSFWGWDGTDAWSLVSMNSAVYELVNIPIPWNY